MTPPGLIGNRPRSRRMTAERVELARYSISSGSRVVIGQRVRGALRVTDRPASGEGRSYLVDRGVGRDGDAALKALIRDYLAQSRIYDKVPMATSIVRFDMDQLRARENAP